MANYRVMSWHGIPSLVAVSDDSGATLRKQLPPFFQQEIDRVAMAEGLIDTDAYLDDWQWSEETDREGSTQEVADALVEELAEDWRRANRPG